ncbi:uncharacterized protein JCM15063_002043 [Sporobolomyces koalae]|uniref:uncharacterized protein n=1 Tax=Sporobolomyces koalae TaxID=500713 RepID=UPI00318258E8
MQLIKPNWILHRDETRPTKPWLTLYAIDVHPDGTRVATGGLDLTIRIWNTAPVLAHDKELEPEETCPKLLCTCTSHTGAVVTLKWSHSGAYLASGADDGAVLVWGLDGTKGGKVWGTDTANVENWKATRRLVGHQSDVSNVAWSPDDSYLASVGLDNQVFVWSGTSFELLRKLQGHQGFVKGVVFDPVGQYLATQSDDNTMKIWRTGDWGLEKSIEDAFLDAPKSNGTRPAWSPDGAHIVAPNAMNGPVFVAGVITRRDVATGGGWELAGSLVGHPDIVQVAAYNPLLFLRDPKNPPALANTTTLVAISARSSISLWFSDMSHPFVVLEEVFDRDVLDMAWSKDGLQLWACSSDGQVSVASFSLDEYPPLAPEASRREILSSHGFAPRLLAPMTRPLASHGSSNGAAKGTGTAAQPNKLVARKGPNAKRPRVVPLVQPQPLVQPTAQSASSSAAAFAAAPIVNAPAPPLAANGHAFAPAVYVNTPHVPHAAPNAASAETPNNSRKRKATLAPQTEEGATYQAAGPWLIPSTEYQAGYGAPRLSSSDYRLNGHTLVGSVPVPDDRPEPVVLAPSYCLRDREVTFKVTNRVPDGEAPKQGMERVLQVRDVVSFGKIGVEDSEAKDTFEWRNLDQGDHKGQAEVRVTTTKKTLWTDYLPNWIVLSTGSPVFSAAGCQDGSLVTWSPTGRRLMPTIVLDSPLSFLVAEGSYLLALTALGTLVVWNLSPSIPRPRSIYPPLNIASILSSSATPKHPSPSITTCALLPNGTPLVALSSGSTFTYDQDLASWTRVSEPWWTGSDAWEGRRARNANASSAVGRGVVRSIEGAVNDIVVNERNQTDDVDMSAEDSSTSTTLQGDPATPQGTSKEFTIALTLSHLETRMRAAISLDSPSEYKASLITYAKELAKEGLRSKAEELIRELLGPIYQKPGRKIEDEWSHTVLGLAKRDLLRDVLRELSKDRVTKLLADEYHKILREISAA